MSRVSCVTLIALLLVGGLTAAEEGRLLRFPDVSVDKIAFMHGGDIYLAPRAGGPAVRLTNHPGIEMFPKFSPDGQKIAFSGQYDGDVSVYCMPVSGGSPKRLSYHPGVANMSERNAIDNIVMGWSRDGKSVLYRGRKEVHDSWEGKAYLVNAEGGLSEPLPMKTAGFTSFSPDGKKVAYCPIFRDFRTWKRYKGGMAQDVWTFDLGTLEAKKITDWIGTDNMPMWYQDRIYFNSDRPDGKLNLFCYDLNTGQTRQVTQFTEFDVRWPSLGPDAIAFENGGYIYLLDLPSETVHKVVIEMAGDELNTRPEFVKVSDNIQDFELSPDAKRAVFAARGDVFTVPAKEGNTRNLTNSSGAVDHYVCWSPDGKWIAYVSDETGEDEIYLINQDGTEKVRLTTDGHCRRYEMAWSPDSKRLVYSDKELKLYAIDIATKKVTQLDSSTRNEFHGFAFSPDSRFLAYNKQLKNTIQAIFVYDFTDGAIHQITAGYTNDYSPSFDPDGKYLYFISERKFNPLLGSYEFQFVNSGIDDIYLILLSAKEKSPFAPESDEVAVTGEEDKGKDKDKEKKGGPGGPGMPKEGEGEKAEPVKVTIDFEGIFDRQVAIDLPAGNYGGLLAYPGGFFYASNPLFGLMGPVGNPDGALHKYDLKEKKDDVFASGVNAYTLTPKGDKIMIQQRGAYRILPTAGGGGDAGPGPGGPPGGGSDRLDLSNMEMKLDRKAEYVQMFNEAWRLERDFFYDANMHGVDWPKMKARYAPLLPYVDHRFDLTYVISEMISELSCSHTYAGGGDLARIPSSGVGLFGCDFTVDKANNRLRITNILKGENWDVALRSPLTEPDNGVKEGEYLLAIDGKEVTAGIDPYSLTENTVGKLVTLKVNDKPTMTGARDVVIKPLAAEDKLRYYDWVERNRAYVDSASGGKIGYIHVPDMDGEGLVRFLKMFYHQSRREGLIIDDRWNGGGFVSQLILDRLRVPFGGVAVSRCFEPGPAPDNAITAHLLALQNEFSVSDGDNFPHFFQLYKLGKTMGKRTWGGIVGIRGYRQLSDGGYITAPEFTELNPEGKWVVEGVGVVPDIEVDNPPDRLARGYDDQLIQGVQYLLKKIKDEPRPLPPYPGPPAER